MVAAKVLVLLWLISSRGEVLQDTLATGEEKKRQEGGQKKQGEWGEVGAKWSLFLPLCPTGFPTCEMESRFFERCCSQQNPKCSFNFSLNEVESY